MNAVTVTTRSRARDFIIKRPRLTKLLDDSTSRLLLLVAPAGYGKTTLAREWTAERQHVGWYAGGPAMADVAALCVGVVEVLARLHEPPKEDVVERVRILAARGHDPRGLAKAVAGAAPGAQALLVIDDYQYIAESDDAEAFVDELVSLTEFRLLLTSRERPGWLAARKVVYGEATVIEMDALAFTDEEARAVLGERKAGREQILAEARGWPAVIGLAAMQARGTATSLRGSEIFDFIAEDLFRSAPEALKRALFMLALAGDVAPEVATSLLGESGTREIADAADRGFLTGDPGVALHPLLRAFLIAQLGSLREANIQELVSSVVAFLSARKQWDACLFAMEHFPDPTAILSTLGLALGDLLDSGRVATVRRWLAVATAREIDDPLLLLAESEVALRQGNEADAQALGECAGGLLEGDLAARAYLAAARGAHLRGNPDGVRANCERVAASKGELPAKIDALWVAFSSARERSTSEAEDLLGRIKVLGHLDVAHSMRVLAAEGMLLADSGILHAAIERLELAQSLLPRIGDPFARTNLLHFVAYVNLLLSRYDEAIAAADLQLAEGRESGIDFVVDHGLLRRAGALIGVRNFAAAQRAIDELERRRSSTSPHVRENALLQLVRLRIGLGDLDRAAVLLEHEPLENRPTYRSELFAYKALVSASLGKLSLAKELLTKRRAYFAFAEALALSRLAEIVIALQRGSQEVDEVSVASLLSELFASGQLDAVVTAVRTFPDLAVFAATTEELHKPLAELLARSRDMDIARRAGMKLPRPRHPGQALSPREREVYELLIQGRGNGDIAKTLFISVSTAKVHVRHIYEKLDVHSRAEAARLATLADEL